MFAWLRSQHFGNPRDVAEFIDESWNRSLARIGSSSHSHVFERDCLVHFSHAFGSGKKPRLA